MKQLRFGAMLFGAVVLTAAVVAAQGAPAAPAQGGGGGRAGGGGGQQAALTNLQVLPKDMPRNQVIPIMQQFEAALQVDCGHCHVWTGAGLPTNDYASDIKPAKKVAREMLKMVMAANSQFVGPAIQANMNRAAAQVTCAMCHRGKSTPVVETYPVPGAPAGGARPGGGGAPAPGGAPAGGRQ
jgi:hypothetical protein